VGQMKIAFIGVGGIAGNYRRSLKRLNQPVAAVCDIDPARAEQVASEEGARSSASPGGPVAQAALAVQPVPGDLGALQHLQAGQ
jgi:predicted dehydrogenase